MKPATIHQIKTDLATTSSKELMAVVLRLAKHKKENKELISYLLFDASDEKFYIEQVKKSVDEIFEDLNINHVYYAKKTIRKALKMLDKYIRFSGKPSTETELRIYYCELIQASNIPLFRSQVLLNLYNRQIIKIDKAMSKMHEDEQFDFKERLNRVR